MTGARQDCHSGATLRTCVIVWGTPLGFAVAAAWYLWLGLGARPSASFAWLVVAAAVLGALVVALWRMLQAVSHHVSDEAGDLGGERRELEREKLRTLRSLKELEFDFRMGKLSDRDYNNLDVGLRERATRLMREIDEAQKREIPARTVATGRRTPCNGCAVRNDPDARFCKGCGARLEHVE